MNPEAQQQVNKFNDGMTGDPLALLVVLAVRTGTFVLKTTFCAVFDATIARIWINTVLYISKFVLPSVNLRMSFVYFYIGYKRAYFQDLFWVVLRLLSRDGADNDNVPDVMNSAFRCLVYGTELLVIVNFSTLYSCLKAWLPFLSTLVATIVTIWTVGVHHFNMPILAPFLKFYEMLPWFKGPFLRMLRLIGRAAITFYAYTGQAYRKYYAVKVRLLGDNKPSFWGQPYVYSPLSRGRSIRLLRLSRKGPFGDYSCEIIHTRLEEAPVFEAISYHWGDSTLDSKLMVNNRTLEVTARVIDIIQSRASFIDEKLLWIDSVCINQSDLVEKSSQVLLMTDIYRSAGKVLVWLGTSPDAFYAMSYMARARGLSMVSTDQEKRKGIMGMASNDPRGPALYKFLNHPWWTRAWVVQETVVAKKVVISYGDEYVTWSYLESFFHVVDTLTPEGSATSLTLLDATSKTRIPAAVYQIPLLTEMRNRYLSDSASCTIHDLLQLTRACQTSDPRDKVYAFVGLTGEIDEPLLVPDYTKSVAEVFSNTARYLCSRNTLATLASAGIGYPCQVVSLPSWAPDFSSLRHNNTIHLTSTSPIIPGAYHAAGNSEASCELHQALPVLRTSSLLFDSIAILGPECIVFSSDEMIDMINFETMVKSQAVKSLQIDKFIQDHIGDGTYPFTGQPCHEVVWRVQIGDRCGDGEALQRPALDVYGQYFDARSKHITEILEQLKIPEPSNRSDGVSERNPESDAKRTARMSFAKAKGMAGAGKRVAMTQQGAMCLVPSMSQVGDVIGVMKGAQACMALRKQAMSDVTKDNVSPSEDLTSKADDQHTVGWTNPQWRFVGNCYVHGFMDGEALSQGQDWEDIYIW